MNLRPQVEGDPSEACSTSQEEQFQALLSRIKVNDETTQPAHSDASPLTRRAARKGHQSRLAFLELASAFLAGMMFAFLLLILNSANASASCTPCSIIRGLIFPQIPDSVPHKFTTVLQSLNKAAEELSTFSSPIGSQVSDPAPTIEPKKKEKSRNKAKRKDQKKRDKKKKLKGKTEVKGKREVKKHGRNKDAGHKQRKSKSRTIQRTDGPGKA
ncbi:hypothetical protein SISNIDRAFT_482436 [Sistotremastrum niveocremeum HHB9708]|uniref:Uncharacterized protein n=1 Tax=Sistotremastrum niveocremeum HHB9708 TaxID=1314777 RepID=A0A164Y6U6_9AGAM|nr:hypothetical protein SISNIDRAFT_482436 [Sistotremastrum niveocremeum HHB9708]